MEAYDFKKFEAAQAATLNFYEKNAIDYATRTLDADLSGLYEPFLGMLEAGARILDVGCGAGRDLTAFLCLGYKPFGIDASPALAHLAQLNSGVPTSVVRIEDIDYREQYEAVWACASLLHLPKYLIGPVLLRLHRALVDSGVLFVSVQEGEGEDVIADGRFFARYSVVELCEEIRLSGFAIQKQWLTGDTLSDRRSLRWVNVLAKRI